MQLRGVSPGRVGQVLAFDLDDGQVGQRISAHHLGRQNAAVAHGDANVGGAIHHVVIGHDVAVGRDDHAAAQPVLNPRLLRPHLLAELPAKLMTKKLSERAVLHAFRRVVFAMLAAFARDVTVTFTMAGVTRAARVSMAWSSESSAPTLLSSSGVVVGAAIAAALAGIAFTKS